MKIMEQSILATNHIEARPQELMCAVCRKGGAEGVPCGDARAEALISYVREHPNGHIHIVSAFDEAGARTPMYGKLSPAERRLDLEICMRLDVSTEQRKTPRYLYRLVKQRLTNMADICGGAPHDTCGWGDCPHAKADYFAKGLPCMVPEREECDMLCAKRESCEAIAKMDVLTVRSHLFMCMLCIVGTKENAEMAPLHDDNLYELWMRIVADHEQPIRLVDDIAGNIICPPCPALEVERGLCVKPSGIRDRKKDLDVFRRLGIAPGTILSARELIEGLAKYLPSNEGVCIYHNCGSQEWYSCAKNDAGYKKGLAKALATVRGEI